MKEKKMKKTDQEIIYERVSSAESEDSYMEISGSDRRSMVKIVQLVREGKIKPFLTVNNVARFRRNKKSPKGTR